MEVTLWAKPEHTPDYLAAAAIREFSQDVEDELWDRVKVTRLEGVNTPLGPHQRWKVGMEGTADSFGRVAPQNEVRMLLIGCMIACGQ